MTTLCFSEDLCADCETCDCLMRCQYIDLDLAEAKSERARLIRGADCRVLKECVTCYACEEYCPYGNHPFYLTVERQEERAILPVPSPITKSQVTMMAPRHTIETRTLAAPVMHMCAFMMLQGSIRGSLFEGVSLVGSYDTFCNLMFLHFARGSVIKERLPRTIANLVEHYLAPNRIEELICYHDECYGAFTSWAPAFGIEVPFRPIHFFDFLYERLRSLQARIKPLRLQAAYQRPCSNRLCPATDARVDDIFALIGVERVPRRYDRQNALCCSAVISAQQQFERAEENQDRNVADMAAAGATHCVFNCPFCFFTLGEKVSRRGMTPIMMSDLCLQALGE
jgi:Fe-S oxidoreductase